MQMTIASPVAGETKPKELDQLDALETELQQALPGVEGADIKRAVGQVWASFRNARVRDFVPLLVRREVLAQLRHRTP